MRGDAGNGIPDGAEIMTACDILVLGAGPAGALTAMLLDARGYRVCVVSAVNRQVRFEGLSDRVRGILGAHECRHALAAVGPTVERHVVWNGAEPEARNREALVERGAFDLGLRQDLVDRGIDLAEATVARISRRDGVWSVDAKGPDGEREIEGRYLVEARTSLDSVTDISGQMSRTIAPARVSCAELT